jgi:hypothetical protein
MHSIKKENIFHFLKAESIIEDMTASNSIEIVETLNIGTNNLSKVTIKDLNPTSKYWRMDSENGTFFEPNSKKVENVILEQTQDGVLNIILIEMKSTTVSEVKVLEKFEKSLTWTYLFLNLLSGKQNQKIKVYGILVAQKNKNWNTKETLNILSSTAIRYTKRSFYTPNSEVEIKLDDILKPEVN